LASLLFLQAGLVTTKEIMMVKKVLVTALLPAAVLCSAGNKPINAIGTSEKVVALTFDDGPNPKVLGEMLSLFQKEKVKATFFMNGKHVEKHAGLAARAIQEGHEVGNHTMTHARQSTISSDDAATEVGDFQTLMKKKFDYIPTSFRAPYLVYTDETWKSIAKHKLTAFNASILSKDCKKTATAESIASICISKVKPGGIVLLHERDETLKALPKIVSYYKKAGYSFVTLNELLKHR